MTVQNKAMITAELDHSLHQTPSPVRMWKKCPLEHWILIGYLDFLPWGGGGGGGRRGREEKEKGLQTLPHGRPHGVIIDFKDTIEVQCILAYPNPRISEQLKAGL